MDNLTVVLSQPPNTGSLHFMQLAAAYSGLAIESSMLGSAHSAANPLTAHFGVTHGHAVATVLPNIIEYNAEALDVSRVYARLMFEAGLCDKETPVTYAVRYLVDKVREIFMITGLEMSLEKLGVTRQAIPQLANEACGQWTARFNPRSMTVKDFETIYRDVF